MNEAQEILSLALPLLSYILPSIFILTVFGIADLLFDFAVRIVSSIRNHVRI